MVKGSDSVVCPVRGLDDHLHQCHQTSIVVIACVLRWLMRPVFARNVRGLAGTGQRKKEVVLLFPADF